MPCVYFQNSGLGNAINSSIAIKKYTCSNDFNYWLEGAPKVKDEPQHITKGKLQRKFEYFRIECVVLDKDNDLKKVGKNKKMQKG